MQIQTMMRLLVLTSVILLLMAPSGMAGTFPHPKVAYSADMTMTISQPGSDQPFVIRGKLYSTKGKERREINSFGRRTAIIKDREKNQVLTLMPDQKMYMVNQDPRARKDPEQMIRDGELVINKMGKETVNGVTATKYKITSTEKQKETFSGFAWLDKNNIPLRFKGTVIENGGSQNIRIDYANINVARQDPQLFVVPADYQAMAPGFGAMTAPGKNMTPEQIEQMMKMLKQQQGAN